MRQQSINAMTRPRNRAIHPFTGQQQRPLDPMRTAKLQQRPLQCSGVSKPGEMVKGGDNDLAHAL